MMTYSADETAVHKLDSPTVIVRSRIKRP